MDIKKVDEARDYIAAQTDLKPRLGIIIGTGLEGILDSVEVQAEIPYTDIPGFVNVTVAAHAGNLVFGRLNGIDAVIMNGRFHLYEGYSAGEVVFPVYVMKAIGIEYMLVSNACGGINPDLPAGSIVIVDDHINLIGANPLIGPNDERLGPRYPDMFNAYDSGLKDLAAAAAEELGLAVKQGVYAAVSGPNLETPAEYRWLRTIGADVVGMSTVPEIIAGVHCGLKNVCLSVVTDECWPEALKPVDIAEIIRFAGEASGPLCGLTAAFAGKLAQLS
jgi:purine-nucleoside phosphorylase